MEINVTGTEARVCQEIAKRQQLGLRKYGISVENNRLDKIQWANHLKEELLDAAIYAQRLIDELMKLEDDGK